MKNILLLFFSVLSILISAQDNPNIKWLHPSPQGWNLRWAKMWDANNWYLAGEYGSFMKTTDAGLTWTTNNKAGWPEHTYDGVNSNWHAYAGWFFDQNNGFMVGANTGGVLKTTNGGETFDTLRILPNGTWSTLNNIYFVNSNLGFICGRSTWKIYKTTDGGTTWNQLPNLDNIVYHDIYASDELNIMACTESGTIYKTTNGGASWNIIQLPTLQPIYDMEFINATTGYVCGGQGFFKYTTDAGATWSGASTPLAASNYKVKFLNNEVFVAGNNTNLFKTTDNGQSWITLAINAPTLVPNPNYCMDAVGSNILVAGGFGNIYKSTNSGGTWNNLLQRVTDASFIRSLYVENTSGKMIAVGHWTNIPGSIIYSNDGGNTWQASPFISHPDSMLERMQMFNNNEGYFSGQFGFFAKTTDGGLNLTRITIPFAGQNFIYDMDFINQSTGWVVGGLPVLGGTSLVAKTTDGGISWISQTPGTVAGLIGKVDFVNENVGYMANFTLHKTTNGGSTWNAIAIPGATGNVTGIKAFDADNVYVYTAGRSEFFKTRNGGLTWQQLTLPGSNLGIFGQVWKDMDNGFLTCTLGQVVLTSDGGSTWTSMNTGGWTAYGGYMVSPDTFYVSAGNGQIFRYAKPSTQTTFPLTVAITNGWNMVSVPGVNPAGQGVSTWWPNRNLLADVYKWNGSYSVVTNTTPGEGYWMLHTGAQTYNYPAIQIVNHDPIPLTTGWNMIGGYENTPLVSGLTTTPPGLIVAGTVYGWTGSYTNATNLVPGYGYWLLSTGNGVINPPTMAAGSSKISEQDNSEWGKILVTDATGKSYTLYAVNGNLPNGAAGGVELKPILNATITTGRNV